MRGNREKQSSYSDDSKYGAFSLGKPDQNFKIYSHIEISDHIIGEGQLYYDTLSQSLKYICELFRNI